MAHRLLSVADELAASQGRRRGGLGVCCVCINNQHLLPRAMRRVKAESLAGSRRRRYPVAKVKGGWSPTEDEQLRR
jgi:hypothetical protein